MNLSIIITLISAVVLIFYIRAKSKKYDYKELILKMIVSTGFIAVAIAAGSLGNKTIFLPVIIGLILGWIGDFALDMKYINREHETFWTYSGFIVFGIGHAFYMNMLYNSFGRFIDLKYTIIVFAAGVAVALFVAFGGKLFGNNYGKDIIIVGIYAFMLFSMAAMACIYAAICSFKVPILNMFALAGICFSVSDLVLGGTFYGKGHEKPVDFILNYATYYAAQFLIALSLLYI